MNRIFSKVMAFTLGALSCPPFLSGQSGEPGESESPAALSRTYRTDADADESLPWHQLKEGEFPPPDSAHYISGELISVNHTERKFTLRADRTDRQNRSHFDLPLAASMLPFGSIYFHGAPAALEDIPLGTHIHGHFYLKDPAAKNKPIEGWHGRVTPEADFNRCFRLQDDFSFYRRNGKTWTITEVNLEENNLSAVLTSDGQGSEAEKPVVFELLESTRVWIGNGMGEVEEIEAGQEIQFSLTWATLYGPGRIREIWLDEASRKLATAHQLSKHIVYQKQRGLAGWVDQVDNQARIVTITFFEGAAEQLLEEFKKGETAGVAVARESLMTYDPVNDRKRGPMLDIREVEKLPGCSGMQIDVKPELLLEGYRPGKIVRVYPPTWPVIALPKEEQYFGRY